MKHMHSKKKNLQFNCTIRNPGPHPTCGILVTK